MVTTLAPPAGYLLPETYGAKGDGKTNDRDALATCLSAAQKSRKGVWLTPGAIYTVGNGMISMSRWNGLIIKGNGATIKRHPSWRLTPGSAGFADIMIEIVDCCHFQIDDLTIDGNRSVAAPRSEFGHNLNIVGASTDFLLRNVRSLNACGDGLYYNCRNADSESPERHPRRNRFVGCVFDNAHRNGVSTQCAHETIWDGCTFAGSNGTNPGAGIDIEPIVKGKLGRYTADTTHHFLGCVFRDNDGFGLMMGAHSDPITSNVNAIGCTFDHNGKIEFSDHKRPNRGSLQLAGFNHKIIGCHFTGHTDGRGNHPYTMPVIGFKSSTPGSGAMASRNIIANCTFANNPACGHCIASQHLAGKAGTWETDYALMVTGCYFDIRGMQHAPGAGRLGDKTAAAISWQYDRLTATNNIIEGDGNQDGIRIVQTSGSYGASRNIIDGNRIEACDVGIVVSGTQYSVWGNTLINCKQGIEGEGGASRFANNVEIGD
jgi:hypothetical protein